MPRAKRKPKSLPVRWLRYWWHDRWTRVGLAFAVLTGFVYFGAVLRQINLLLIVFGLLIGILFVHLIGARRQILRLRAECKRPSSVFAGETFVAAVRLSNVGHGTSEAILVEDSVWAEPATARRACEGRVARFRPAVLFERIAAGETREGRYEGRLLVRGRYELGPLRMSTTAPLGLTRFRKELDDTHELIVLPAPGRLRPNWQGIWKHEKKPHATRTSHRPAPTEGEFHGLRPWRDGDRPRWIHWRSTARHGNLMVRQFERPEGHDLALLVDLWVPAKPTAEDRDRVERAIRFVAGIATELCRRGGSHLLVSLATTQDDGPALIAGEASPALLSGVLTMLALAESVSDAGSAASLLKAGRAQIRPSHAVWVITTRPNGVRSADLSGLTGPLAELLDRATVLEAGRTQLEEYCDTDGPH